MKRPIPFHPVLFAAYPLLALYQHNMALIQPVDLLRPLAYVLLLTGLVWLLAGWVLRSWLRGAAVASAFALWLLIYGHAHRQFGGALVDDFGPSGNAIFRQIWWGLAPVLAVLAGWQWRRGAALAGTLNLVSAALALMVGVGIVAGWMAIRRDLAGQVSDGLGATGPVRGPRLAPDIFYIIVDGYGSQKAIEHAMGYDDSALVQGLEARGFYVAADSHPNYVQTELSLASSLNMRLIQELLPRIASDSQDRAPLDHLIDQNAVSVELRKRGYLYLAVTSGFPSMTFRSADLVAQSHVGMTLFEATLMEDLPWSPPQEAVLPALDNRRTLLTDAFRSLRDLSHRSSKPRFIFAHVFAPHPPFVFEADGSPRKRDPVPLGYYDGSHYMAMGGTPAMYQGGYVAQIQHINAELLATVDALLARHEGPPPTIVIQGDHGSKMRLDQGSLAKTDLAECFGILNAYYVPDAVKKRLYPTITPVNTFRLILGNLLNESLPPKPDRSFYSTWERPYLYDEVTARLP